MAYNCFEFTVVIKTKYSFIHNFCVKVNPHKSTTRLEDKTLVYRVGQIGNLSLCALAQGFHTKLSRVITATTLPTYRHRMLLTVTEQYEYTGEMHYNRLRVCILVLVAIVVFY